jgi:hypothetical protein
VASGAVVGTSTVGTGTDVATGAGVFVGLAPAPPHPLNNSTVVTPALANEINLRFIFFSSLVT